MAANLILSNASASSSAPEIHTTTQVVISSSVMTSPSVDSALVHSSIIHDKTSLDPSPSLSHPSDPDAQIVEALRSKDRIWVLKLAEQMENLINDRKARIDVTNPMTSYQRMLVHRCSAYYKLVPETDPSTKTIFVFFRPDSKIPIRRVAELVPLEENISQPAFKIMRRNAQDKERARTRFSSQPASVAGEDVDLSDVEQSETSSVGGRSNATGTSKRHLTIEEREAAYKEARSRIFMDFDEKEAEKEKDSSANSSTHSLISGSGSISGGRSSAGDADDSASSAATESEWSGPAARDKKDGRRGGSTTSSRSTRLSDTSYTKNGSGSSRNSRATSPSFTYPSLYEPPSSSYDTPYGQQGSPHGYIQYYYPYPPPPGHMPGQPYMTAYPYYPPPYGYSSPPHQTAPHHPDSSSSGTGDAAYSQGQPPPPMAPYPNPSYMWPPPPPGPQPHLPPPPQSSHSMSPTPIQQPSQGQPPSQLTSYPYMQPGPYAPYPMPGYYPPPPFQSGQPMQPPPMQGHHHGQQDMIHSHDGAQHGVHNGNHPIDSSGNSRASSRNSNNHAVVNGRRNAPRNRQAWNHGPGGGGGGGGFQYGGQVPEAVGPRLATRRTSGTSSGGTSTGNRTPADEASSTPHPLPARPDWAVGLRPHLNNAHSRTMSPARVNNQQQPHPSLQPTDFPPLSSGPIPEKRTPVVGSAWTNTIPNRSVMSPGLPGGVSAPAAGSALVHYPGINNGNGDVQGAPPRMEEVDRGYDRPPPKVNAELFNPKGGVRKPTANRLNSGPVDKENNRLGLLEMDKSRVPIDGTLIMVPTLAGQMGGMSLDDRNDLSVVTHGTSNNGEPSSS